MAKVLARMPLGRSPSQDTKPFPTQCIIIHLYGDVDAAANQIIINEPGKSFKAEYLCTLAGRKLSISTLGLHLFALAPPDLKIWLAPNEDVICPENDCVEYIFRLRFKPHVEHIERRTFGAEAFSYFYLQVRDDFVKDRLKKVLANVEREKILGLGVTDIHRFGRDHNLDLNDVLKKNPKKFLPESVVGSFSMPSFLMLKNSFRTELKRAYGDSTGSNAVRIKLQYLKGLLMYVPTYATEQFELEDKTPQTLIVDPYCSENPGITWKTEHKIHHVCRIEDVLNIRLFESEKRVQVDRSQGTPYVFIFPSLLLAKSFISLIDGYHRLTKNFHFHICPVIFSPRLELLRELRFHGPVSKDWAKFYLQDRNKVRQEFNYMVKQQRGPDTGNYSLLFISPRDPSKRVITLSVNQLDCGSFQIAIQNEDIFENMQQLLQYYEQGSHPTIHLRSRLGPPTQHPVPDDAGLYLCKPLPKILDEDEEDELSAPPHHKKSTVSLVSGINIVPGQLGAGQFTEVYKGFLDKEEGMQVVGVAVKQLLSSATVHGAYQALMEATHKLSFWSHPTIVSVVALCLSPQLQVLQELAELGCLEDYLQNPKNKIWLHHLLIAAEQISQAVLYLQQESLRVSSCTHGNIRCRSILVFSHTQDNLVIKMGDPGMVAHYKKLPLDHHENLDRLPWIAPELYSDLTAVTVHSDRFSLGITFWEIFSLGDRPFLHRSPENVRQLVSQGIHLDRPGSCPEEMYELMVKCWQVVPELRPTAQEIVRDVRNICHNQMMDTGNIYSEASSHYTLENIGEAPATAKTASDGIAAGDHVSNSTDSTLVDQSSPISQPVSGGSEITSMGSDVPLLGPDWSGQVEAFSQITGVQAAGITNSHPTSSSLLMDPVTSQRPLPEIPGHKYILKREHIHIDPSIKPLGMGYYGKVHQAEYYKDGKMPGRKVAIKSLKANMFNQHTEEFENEFNTMVKLKHKNIVSIIGQCPQRDSENPMLLVMEYVENGCLLHYLSEHKNQIPKKRLLDFAEEIAEGMVYLSDKHIIHRDLAARNVLVTRNITMKISDFGLARILDPHRNYYKSKPSCEMPYRWCAPESLIYQKFSTQSDVWSYGITLWEIFSYGKPPVLCEDRSLHNALLRGRRLGCPEGCPKEIHNLMMPCWEYYALNRKSFRDIQLVLRKFQESGICGTADNDSYADSGPSRS